MPWSDEPSCGAGVIVQGIDMSFVNVPLHRVKTESDLVSCCFNLAVCTSLPVSGIHLIMGNDVAGGKVHPVLELLKQPKTQASEISPDIFSACVLLKPKHVNGMSRGLCQTPF